MVGLTYMELIGETIKLTPFNSTDMDLFVEISMCPKMMEYVRDPLTQKEAITQFHDKSKSWTPNGDGWLSFGITDLKAGEKVGSIGLKIVNHEKKIAEVGFMIKQSAQGKGFAGEALNLIKKHACNTLCLNKLIAICTVNNTPSYNLLEKLKFKREKRLKKNVFINKKWFDDYVYGLPLNKE